MRQLEGIIQGSDEWREVRRKFNVASEASVVMGAAKHTMRSELLRMKATGDEKEYSAWFRENILDAGHSIEEAARPFAEAVIGEELYPITGVNDEHSLLASFDGITLMEDVVWECKSANQEKIASVLEGRVPECDYWQVVHQLVVSGAEKALYTVSDGTKEGTLHSWMTLNPDDEKKLLAGWRQFNDDLANYEPQEVKAEVVANPQASLPSLSVKVSGEITVIDNLERFGLALNTYVERLNMKPETDQDFADLDAACKKLKEAEDELTSGEERALAQTESIQILRNTINEYRELARTTRLRAEKVVKAEKENRRNQIRAKSIGDFNAHVDRINRQLEVVRLPNIHIDVADAMKGKKTISSLEDAAATEVARAKAEASIMADRIRDNLKIYEQKCVKHKFLFNDLQNLVVKDTGDFNDLVTARVIAHEAQEKRKVEEQRESIRREEEAKAKREAEVLAEKERLRIRDEERAKIAEAEQKVQASVEAARDAGIMDPGLLNEVSIMASDLTASIASDDGARIKLGDINAAIAPLSISADGLAQLGFPHVDQDKAAKLYRASDFHAICSAIARHIAQAARQYPHAA